MAPRVPAAPARIMSIAHRRAVCAPTRRAPSGSSQHAVRHARTMTSCATSRRASRHAPRSSSPRLPAPQQLPLLRRSIIARAPRRSWLVRRRGPGTCCQGRPPGNPLPVARLRGGGCARAARRASARRPHAGCASPSTVTPSITGSTTRWLAGSTGPKRSSTSVVESARVSRVPPRARTRARRASKRTAGRRGRPTRRGARDRSPLHEVAQSRALSRRNRVGGGRVGDRNDAAVLRANDNTLQREQTPVGHRASGLDEGGEVHPARVTEDHPEGPHEPRSNLVVGGPARRRRRARGGSGAARRRAVRARPRRSSA